MSFQFQLGPQEKAKPSLAFPNPQPDLRQVRLKATLPTLDVFGVWAWAPQSLENTDPGHSQNRLSLLLPPLFSVPTLPGVQCPLNNPWRHWWIIKVEYLLEAGLKYGKLSYPKEDSSDGNNQWRWDSWGEESLSDFPKIHSLSVITWSSSSKDR